MPNPFLPAYPGDPTYSNPTEADATFALAYAQETQNLLHLVDIALGQQTNTPQMSPTAFQILLSTIHERVEADL